MIKLLCRFYDPEAGRVEIGRRDIREMRLEELRSGLSVLFQEPVHYAATAAENIALGDLSASKAQIETAATEAGADEPIFRLPRGFETLLGKWFEGGAELSTGEWQRVSLARALLRPAPVLLLDEPTSAMDPWTEASWLQRFRQFARGRTVLIITHRFSTAAAADVIHVMSQGRIVESGAHDELVERGGLYAQAWSSRLTPAVPSCPKLKANT